MQCEMQNAEKFDNIVLEYLFCPSQALSLAH